MSDYLLTLSRHRWTRPLVQRAGLPTPTSLARVETAYEDHPFVDRSLACGGIALSPAGEAARAALRAAGARFDAGSGAIDMVLFDATAMRAAADLRRLYDFFHPLVARLSSNARVLLLAAAPESLDDCELAAAARAVEGFTRALAKEIGKRGATANLLYVEPHAESRLDMPLRFFLSPRSAYVDGQPLRLSARVPALSTIDPVAPLKGRRALVTGAAQGLGAATARRLAEEGAQLLCLDIAANQQPLEQLASQIGGEAVVMDVSAPSAPEEIGARLEACGGVDIIVHNAGVTRDKTLAKMDAQRWDSCLAINLEAILRIDRVLVDGGVLRDHGRLVCLSSISGVAGNVGQTNYSATKAGVIGYVAARARQLAARGITANAVAPGLIETPMMRAIPFFFREFGRRLNSLQQGGVPRDVAELITFLATPGASGISGQTIRVCGQNLIGA